MKSGIFHFIKKKMNKTEDSALPFSAKVFSGLGEAKGKEAAEVEKAALPVMDSIASLKDCEEKTVLQDSVADLFSDVELAIENKDSIAPVLDSLFAKAEKITLDSFEEKKVEDAATGEEGDAATGEEGAKDTDGKGANTNNVSDSVIQGITDSVVSGVMGKLEGMLDKKINKAVKDSLGLESDTSPNTQDSLGEEDVFASKPIDMARFV
jgi:hypothetical protein